MPFSPSTTSFRKHTIGAAIVQQISQEINQQENRIDPMRFEANSFRVTRHEKCKQENNDG